MTAKKPCRIIIDIPDVIDFDWGTAKALWVSTSGFSTKNTGYNDRPAYVWYKVNPENNLPFDNNILGRKYMLGTPSPEIVKVDIPVAIRMMQMDINRLSREVYRLKSAKIPIVNTEELNLINKGISDLLDGCKNLEKVYSQ
jgi:hypothetical protein